MTHEIPHAVLSERFQEHMKGRRLRTAVFTTFSFDPGFFEQEVLPVFIDAPLSQSAAVRVAQLEDLLKSAVDDIAVYYSPHALEAGAQPAKLDIRRIPVNHRTGYFHPKIVLLLVEDAEPQRSPALQHLIVAVQSANLTRAGWWENFEASHIEEVSEGASVGYKDDLRALFRRLKAASAQWEDHAALDTIAGFVDGLTQRPFSRGSGVLYPRLYSGGASVTDFLAACLGGELAGLNLEVISPFFSATDVGPLEKLVDTFEPREVRVLLPREDDGSAACTESLYAALERVGGASWGKLPTSTLRVGKSENARIRRVHAKVYRFFHPTRRYEAVFVGSVNLTAAAHSKGGNFEAAFLIETEPDRVPDWWMAPERAAPRSFQNVAPDEPGLSCGLGIHLALRYDWASRRATAAWGGTAPSPRLSVESNGVHQFSLESMPPGAHQMLPATDAHILSEVLTSTSFVTVAVDGNERVTILVQEEGMAAKPSLFMRLSAADILRYWSLLTPDQRAAFLEERIAELPAALHELGLTASARWQPEVAGMFSTFAGIFHAFGNLERAISKALDKGRDKEAVYRLFGEKYDSLPHLIDKILRDEGESDTVTRYVILLCASQLANHVAASYPEFEQEHHTQFASLRTRVSAISKLRESFAFGTPEDRAAFLQWFEGWFLIRINRAEVRR